MSQLKKREERKGSETWLKSTSETLATKAHEMVRMWIAHDRGEYGRFRSMLVDHPEFHSPQKEHGTARSIAIPLKQTCISKFT